MGNKSNVIIGIDPGASGAMCCRCLDGVIEYVDFKKSGITGYANFLRELLSSGHKIEKIYLEHVHAMPGQGVSSMFSFGERYGEIKGMLDTLGLTYELVRPAIWQKVCGVEPKSGKKGIAEAINKLYKNPQVLTPRGALIDGRCDALGIAHFGYRQWVESKYGILDS